MSVRLNLKGATTQEVLFPDDETFHFTARDFPDGHLEVTQTRRGTSETGIVVAQFTKAEIERVIENGWPSGD